MVYVQSLVVEPNPQRPDPKDRLEAAETEPAAKEHVRYELLLERHLDGELSAAERFELFEHIEHCARCREILETEEALIDQLARIPRLMPPSDLRARILEEAARQREELMQGGLPLEDEIAPHHPVRRRSSPLVPVFLVLSILFFLLTVDFSAVPGLGALQAQLRAALQYAGQQMILFFRDSRPTR